MEAAVASIEDPIEGIAAGKWLAWSREHAKTIDPLTGPLSMPADPEPSPAALAPFMETPWRAGGFSGSGAAPLYDPGVTGKAR